MDLKKPLTFDEQLDKLIAHGMVISDRESQRYFEKSKLLPIYRLCFAI